MNNKSIVLKITNWNIVKHYFSFMFQLVIIIVAYIFGIVNIIIVALFVFGTVIIELVSLPLLISYLKVNWIHLLNFSENKIQTYDNEQNIYIDFPFDEINYFLFVKPLYNKGGLSFGEFNFLRIYFKDNRTLTITSIMYNNELEDIIKFFPNVKVHRVKSIYCRLDRDYSKYIS